MTSKHNQTGHGATGLPILTPAFSNVLAAVLSRHGITRYRFADASGLDGGHVSRLARGLRSRPMARTVRKIDRTLARLGVPNHEIDAVVAAAGFQPLAPAGPLQAGEAPAAAPEEGVLGPPTRMPLCPDAPARPVAHDRPAGANMPGSPYILGPIKPAREETAAGVDVRGQSGHGPTAAHGFVRLGPSIFGELGALGEMPDMPGPPGEDDRGK